MLGEHACSLESKELQNTGEPSILLEIISPFRVSSSCRQHVAPKYVADRYQH
jgi:hypothetical protein